MQDLVGAPGYRQAGAASRLQATCQQSRQTDPGKRGRAVCLSERLGDRDGMPPAPGVCGLWVQISGVSPLETEWQEERFPVI